jgi:hypothetical protein
MTHIDQWNQSQVGAKLGQRLLGDILSGSTRRPGEGRLPQAFQVLDRCDVDLQL